MHERRILLLLALLGVATTAYILQRLNEISIATTTLLDAVSTQMENEYQDVIDEAFDRIVEDNDLE